MRQMSVVCGVVLMGAMLAAQGAERPRARDLGIQPGRYAPGPLNAITDVPGVRVGHVTLVQGSSIRTGVTAIVPHDGNVFQDKVAGAVFVGNAFGKLAGSTQVQELGTIETPIVLTNTLAVGRAVDAVVGWTLEQPGNEDVRSVNALVGETNDGFLNDIRARAVTEAHVRSAIESAAGGTVAEGAVGAGTGTICYGWKGGIGTASRIVPIGAGEVRLGVLVQTNFGGDLVIDGVPVWRTLQPQAAIMRPALARGDGSVMIVVATDAAIGARDLERLAARAVFALARTGSSYSHGSGDYAIAFSTSPEVRVRYGETSPRVRHILPSESLSPLFRAVLEATEEAVYNSLLKAEDVTGYRGTIRALPIERLKTMLER
ncbi:MAG TPA: P1 family peptidase [Vicinamibacterales bacterium]